MTDGRFTQCTYGLAFLLIFISWYGLPRILIWAIAGYAAWRFVLLALEGFSCISCWIGFALSLILLAFAFMRFPPHAYMAAMLLVASAALMQWMSRKDGRRAHM